MREVGLRDGLQLSKTFLPTEQKLAWLRKEASLGVTDFEVTSFVPPAVIPQFADAAEVARAAVQLEGVRVSALVPNAKGAERAIANGITRINFVLSASNDHNLSNVRRSTEESIADFRTVAEAICNHATDSIVLAGGVATAFGCAIAGPVDERRVIDIAVRLVEYGASQLIIADTVGYANPDQVKRLFKSLRREVGDIVIFAHFHDTRGLGLPNVLAALEADIRYFDASLGGLGGCPFAPGATGNINFEDAVYLLESLGFDTGVDIDGLVNFRREVETWLPTESFQGRISNAGLPKGFRPARLRQGVSQP